MHQQPVLPYVEEAPIPGVDEYVSNCFPTSGLIHRTMHYLVQTGYTAPFHHLVALLPAVANLMAQRGWTGVGRNRQIAIQTLIVGPSGAAKSTAIREVQRIMRETMERYHGSSYSETKHNRWVPCEGSMAGLLESLHDLHAPTWETPFSSYDLGTTPAILYAEELPISFLNKAENLKLMNELFDPVPAVERRLVKYRAMQKNGENAPASIIAPAVSAVFATTPATLKASFNGQHLDGGFSQRLLWAYSRGDIGRLSIDTPDHTQQRLEVVGYWAQALRWHDSENLRVAQREKLLPLHDEVKKLLELSVKQIKNAHARNDDRDVAVRLRNLNRVQCIAQVFAWSRGSYVVHADDLDQAMNLTQLCHDSFTTVADLIEAKDDWVQQKLLLDAIETSGGLSKSECYKVLRCSKPEMEHILDALRDRNVVDLVKVPSSGGRPTFRFIPKRAPVEPSSDGAVVLQFPSKEPDAPRD